MARSLAAKSSSETTHKESPLEVSSEAPGGDAPLPRVPFAGIARDGEGAYRLIEFELDLETLALHDMKVSAPGMRWIVEGQLKRAQNRIFQWLSHQTRRKKVPA